MENILEGKIYKEEENDRNDDKVFYSRLTKKSHDKMGRFMSMKLLGRQRNQPSLLHNVFPQTPWNQQQVNKLEDKIVDYLMKDSTNSSVMVFINVNYTNRRSSRPNSISYYAFSTTGHEFKLVYYLTNSSS